MVIDDVLFPTDMLPLPLNTSSLDDKQTKDPVPDSNDFYMEEEAFIEPHIESDSIDTFVSETTL